MDGLGDDTQKFHLDDDEREQLDSQIGECNIEYGHSFTKYAFIDDGLFVLTFK